MVTFLAVLPIMVYTFRNLVCNHVADLNARNKCLTAKLLKQGYRYHCTTAGWASDSMMATALSYSFQLAGTGAF